MNMERFYYEVPGMKRKEQAVAFIREFQVYKSEINGTGGLHRYLDDYAGWLEKLSADYVRTPDEKKVPARTYFLIRENDDAIIGMSNIRLALNEKLRRYGSRRCSGFPACFRSSERHQQEAPRNR